VIVKLASFPHATVVLAMSADGKIADIHRSAARFGSSADRAHLETLIAQSDGVLFGAGTLRAYGTTLPISRSDLLSFRQQQKKPAQPVQIVASRSAVLDPGYRFFQQSVPRWLITTRRGSQRWQEKSEFEKIFEIETPQEEIDWVSLFRAWVPLGIDRLLILGGGELVASLLAANLIDALWLTVCPLLLGGSSAPTPVEGAGFVAHLAPQLELLSVQTIGQEVFLHYQLKK
jgi:5-amino-6-(5-phosphoribosylamino)uracil reductase